MNNYQIFTTASTFEFTGKYRRDLETANWHYYETECGKVYHFRKTHIIAVFGDSVEDIIKNRE